MTRGLVAALLAGTCLVGSISEAFAQIEEIVVTTRKRAENLQEVPIAVTTFSYETMQRKGISDLADITKYTTGVILDEGFSKQDTRIVIRGLSPTRGRQNVAVMQDDVDISSLAINTAGGTFTINPRLFDTERVEIVKGPHSALYGRQAFNGAINYITKKPGDKFEGNASVDFGTYGKYEGKVGISGPLVEDKLSVGLNAAGWNFNGFYDSKVSGKDLGGGDGGGVAGALVFKPTDILKFTLRSEFSKDHYDVEARLDKIPSTSVALPSAASGGFLTTATNFVINTGSVGDASMYGGPSPSTNPRTGVDYPGFDRKIFRTFFRAEANFEDFSLISISHYGKTNDSSFQEQFAEGPFSSTAVNAVQEVHFINDNRLLTEELRLQSSGNNRFDYTLGGLFWNERTNQNNQSLNCLSFSGGCQSVLAQIGTTVPSDFNQPYKTLRDTHHYSVFGTAEFKITDGLRLSAEVRHTWESEKIVAPSTTNVIIGCPNGAAASFISVGLRTYNPDGTVSCIVAGPQTLALTASNFRNAHTQSSFWTPRVALDYKITPDAMLYVSAGQGVKPGGISLVNGAFNPLTNAYLPEKMWVYEVGAKTEWLDKRLLLNVSGFYQDYTDKQISGTQIDPVTQQPNSYTSNASSARVYGLEVESTFAITEHLTASIGYTFLDTKYSNFSLLNSTLYNIARAGNCTPYTSATGTKLCTNNFSGNQLENAPKHSLQLGANYKQNLRGDIDWFIEGDVHYQSKRFVDYYNQLYYDAYWNMDARIGVQSPVWSITAYVNNLFDDRTVKTGINDFPDFNRSFVGTPSPFVPIGASAVGTFQYVFQGNFPDKRQFGVRASYKF